MAMEGRAAEGTGDRGTEEARDEGSRMEWAGEGTEQLSGEARILEYQPLN